MIKILISVIGIILTVGLFIYFMGRKSIKNYRENITYLEAFILKAPVTRENFDRIITDFDNLSCNDQDNWRTKMAFGRFKIKYWLFVEELSIDNEASDRFNSIQKRVKRA